MSTPAARRLWWAIEPFHAVTVSAAEIGEMYERSGIFDARVGFVATRSAPLGRASAAIVRASFGAFAPWVVDTAVPAAWDVIAPEALLVRRLHAVDQAMWRLLDNELMRSTELVTASQLARRAAEHADCSGRVLAASHQTLEWPTFPHLVLWQATAVLREHRAGGLETARLLAGLSGCESQALLVAQGASTAEIVRENRGWSEDEWETSVGDLRTRGLLTKAGGLTDEGQSLLERIEGQTDELASGAIEVLTDDEQATLRKSLESFSKRVIDAGEFSYPNDLGVPEPPAGLHRKGGNVEPGPKSEPDDVEDDAGTADAKKETDEAADQEVRPPSGEGGRKGGKGRSRRGSGS